MRIKKSLAITVFLIAVLAIAVTSQFSSDDKNFVKYKVSNITNKITVEEKQGCITINYNQTVNIYGNVTRTNYTYGTCFNSTNLTYYRCVNYTEQYQSYEVIDQVLQEKSRDDCESKNSFIVSVNKNNEIVKKEVDFSRYGVCIQEKENDCVAIICGTLEGGSAANGIFNGCDNGKYCQKFLFCDDKIKVLYKGFREGFEEQDPSFHLPKGEIKEVGE